HSAGRRLVLVDVFRRERISGKHVNLVTSRGITSRWRQIFSARLAALALGWIGGMARGTTHGHFSRSRRPGQGERPALDTTAANLSTPRCLLCCSLLGCSTIG